MKLLAGQRFRLREENKFVRLKSGEAEVYAITHLKEAFRQIFLMELPINGAAYPSLDEFEQIDIQIYAVQDSELEILSFNELEPLEQSKLMRAWFQNLIKLPWLRLLADKGDEVLIPWVNGQVLRGSEGDLEALIDDFTENEQIFAMLLGMRFEAEDKRLALRTETRNRHKKNLINAAIDNLSGEESIYGEDSGGEGKLEEIAFLVKRVAKFLDMPANNLKVSGEVVKKLDQVGLIRRLVQKGNMQMRLATLEGDWFQKDSGVFIGYFGEKKELAAFIPQNPAVYKLITTKNPDGVLIDEQIAAQIEPSAFQCYAGLPLRPLKFLDLMKFMLKRSWKVDYRQVLAASFVAGLIPLLTPIITESIFADIVPILDRRGLVIVTQVSIVTAFTMAAISIVRSIAVLRITSHIDMQTESALWGRILALPTSFFRKFQSGELAQRILGFETIKQVVSGEMISAIFNAIFSFWSLLLMCYYSLQLTAAALALWLVYFAATVFIYRKVGLYQGKMVAAKNLTSGLVQQIFTGLPKFRISGSEEQAYFLWSKVFGEEWKWNLQLRLQNNYNTILAAIQPLALTLLLYYVAFYVLSEVKGELLIPGIDYSKFIAFQAAFTGVNTTLSTLTGLVGQFFTVQPHIKNLQPILEEMPEVADDKPDADALSGAIEISHLTFSYTDDSPNVVDDMSFRIAAGENVAIVGKSGCGKSTLLRLLLGFEKPKSGAVYYDGQDLSELNVSSVRSQMGVVLQNGQLMSGDIFTNIVGTTSLTQDDAWEAAKAAGLDEDIKKMPMGMQTVISEGSSNISGGQRQRILIARALAAKPAILIFDEATSALDNRTQAIVTESLNKRNVTRIVVAHRLSTIEDCDRIIVLDKGKIVENGTFDELVEMNGIFADLVRRQIA